MICGVLAVSQGVPRMSQGWLKGWMCDLTRMHPEPLIRQQVTGEGEADLVVAVADDEGICEDQLAHHHALLQRRDATLLQTIAADDHNVVVIQNHCRISLGDTQHPHPQWLQLKLKKTGMPCFLQLFVSDMQLLNDGDKTSARV